MDTYRDSAQPNIMQGMAAPEMLAEVENKGLPFSPTGEVTLSQAAWKKLDQQGYQVVRDWSLITGRGGLQNGKIAGLKLFAPPPPLKTG